MKKHIISDKASIRQALTQLDALGVDAILFLIDEEERLLGSLTDGDIRRGFIKGLTIASSICLFANKRPKFCFEEEINLATLKQYRLQRFNIIPILNTAKQLVRLLNFRVQQSILPIDAVIMAGGKGTRLHPLTLEVPKPLLKIGNRAIIDYNVDLLKKFGINNITLSIGYLGQQLIDHFKATTNQGVPVQFIEEKEPLGTLGSVGLIKSFQNKYILVMNADLLTTIDLESCFKKLLDTQADMIVATFPYKVDIPYGIIEAQGNQITGLSEKPSYTYYANAGIYIFKKELVQLIPKGKRMNATDLIELLTQINKKIVHYPIAQYWLDIGKPNDFKQAQQDIKYLKF